MQYAVLAASRTHASSPKMTHEPAEDAALSKHLGKLGPALSRPENVSNRKTPHSRQLDITKTESG